MSRYDRTRHEPLLRVTFMSYSMRKGQPRLDIPIAMVIACHELEPPDGYYLNRFHGLDDELQDAFFAIPENEDYYFNAWAELKWRLDRVYPHITHVAVLTYCRAGMHRSVAMAERFAVDLFNYSNLNVGRCEHWDLEDSIRRHEQRGLGPYSIPYHRDD